MLTVTYDPVWVYGWLTPKERVGLDIEGTLDRFEGKVRSEMMRWAHIQGVKFIRLAKAERWRFGGDDKELPTMNAQVQLLFIDCHFLRYTDANAHIKALFATENDNIRVSLIDDVCEAYDLPRATVDLIYNLRGSRVMDYAISTS